MTFIPQLVDMERLEHFSEALLAFNDEANRVCKDLFKVTKVVGIDYEWELTVYGKQVYINSDDVLKILDQDNNTNYKEAFKELVAWKLKAI